MTKKPRNISENPNSLINNAFNQIYDNNVPNRRSQSKNDKYNNDQDFQQNVLAFSN